MGFSSPLGWAASTRIVTGNESAAKTEPPSPQKNINEVTRRIELGDGVETRIRAIPAAACDHRGDTGQSSPRASPPSFSLSFSESQFLLVFSDPCSRERGRE